MKPTIIIVVSFVTVSVIGIASMQLQRVEAPESPIHVPFLGTPSAVATHAMSPQSNDAPVSVVSPSDAPTMVADVLKLRSLTERRVGTTDDLEKWTWRVEVENQSDRSEDCYVEIEWLDRTGMLLDSAHEVRRIEPGVHSISMVRAMDWETADQAHTVRVAKLQIQSVPTGE
jgi:hypothetical protein